MSSTRTAASGSRSTFRIALSGEIDLANADQLDQQLAPAFARPNLHVVVDLHELTFMDCAALYHLVRGHQLAQRRGSSFVVVNAPQSMRRLFEVTHTDYMLDDGSSSELPPGQRPSTAGNGSSPPFPAGPGA